MKFEILIFAKENEQNKKRGKHSQTAETSQTRSLPVQTEERDSGKNKK